MHIRGTDFAWTPTTRRYGANISRLVGFALQSKLPVVVCTDYAKHATTIEAAVPRAIVLNGSLGNSRTEQDGRSGREHGELGRLLPGKTLTSPPPRGLLISFEEQGRLYYDDQCCYVCVRHWQ